MIEQVDGQDLDLDMSALNVDDNAFDGDEYEAARLLDMSHSMLQFKIIKIKLNWARITF